MPGVEGTDVRKSRRVFENHKMAFKLWRMLAMGYMDLRGESPPELEARMNATLRERFGHRSFKSSQQAEAVMAVLRREPSVVVILPTGGGKSLVWMLPAAMDRN